MLFATPKNSPDAATSRDSIHPTGAGRGTLLIFLILLTFTSCLRAQGTYDEDGVDQVQRRGLDQIDRITEKLHHVGKISMRVGIVLLVLVGLKVFNPLHLYYSAKDYSLQRAVRDVDDLLKRAREEAEMGREDVPDEEAEEGLLAGMAEIAALTEADDVPAYVLTVNDRILDNVRVTLKRLRRFRDGNAERYQRCMLSVLKGIQVATEACEGTHAASGLAVDIDAYFQDDKRYHAWQGLLRSYAKRPTFHDAASAFLGFMHHVKTGTPTVTSGSVTPAVDNDTKSWTLAGPEVPEVLDESTLPAIQAAATQEAENLLSLIQTERPLSSTSSWQFELVNRQRQLHLREDAQRMLQIFLEGERAALQRICRSKMLPCKTWTQILHVLGVENSDTLRQRSKEGRLVVAEAVVLEKAFLQTFAKPASLGSIYGEGEEARIMLALHLPQIRNETLHLLRYCHQSQPRVFERAVKTLDAEETPQRHEVARLIKHYVVDTHNPPEIKV